MQHESKPQAAASFIEVVPVLNGECLRECLRQKQNHIATTKYTLLTFVPIFVLEQLKKLSNVLFLVIASLSVSFEYFLPICSYFWGNALLATNADSTACSSFNKSGGFIPVGITWLIALTKELYEDYQRRLMDRETNHKSCTVATDLGTQNCRWEEVAVGCIVRLNKGESAPADMVILQSSSAGGHAFIKTVELDGEINFKRRCALEFTQIYTQKHEESFFNFPAKFSVEPPNENIYSFKGSATFECAPEIAEITSDNVILRGTSLQNTDWVYGLVVYAGSHCKVMQNSVAVPQKSSTSLYIVNKEVFKLLLFLLAICCLSTGLAFNWWKRHEKLFPGVPSMARFSNIFITFLKFLLLYNNLVPISVQITLEVIKTIHRKFIQDDRDMIDRSSGKRPQVICSDLIDCIGQIHVIFTDKTGTLTQNIMKFRRVYVDSREFQLTVASDVFALKEDFRSNEIVTQFLHALLCCNSVVPEIGSKGIRTYASMSPDEDCIISWLSQHSLTLSNRSGDTITLALETDADILCKVLYTIEFSSDRKRMTVVVEFMGEVYVYSKGADTSILSRCISPKAKVINEMLDSFSSHGLRTLCVAYKKISYDEFYNYKNQLEQFKRSASHSEAECDEFFHSLIESDLLFLGLTGVEDSLQSGVVETISMFPPAGIRVWMLTGDRKGTAIDIGRLSGIVPIDADFINVEPIFDVDLSAYLCAESNKLSDKPFSSNSVGTNHINANNRTCLLVDGSMIDLIKSNEELMKIFVTCALKCRSVLVYRATPLHKAEMVKFVRKFDTQMVTLAIGDGANDVSMIREAHVGVGIFGREGLQASKSADFSIFQFSHLQKLLFIHGSWAYHRVSKVIQFMFYKNVIFYFTQFLYSFYSGYSGTSAFNANDVAFFNAIYTALPPILIGTVEQYLPFKLLKAYPYLYRLGSSKRFFSSITFWGSVLNGMFQSFISFSIVRLLLTNDILLVDRSFGGKEFFGAVLFYVQFLTIILKAALTMTTWNFASVSGLSLSTLFYILASSYLAQKNMPGLNTRIFSCEAFYLCIIFVPSCVLLKDIIWKYTKREYFPVSYHIALKKSRHDSSSSSSNKV